LQQQGGDDVETNEGRSQSYPEETNWDHLEKAIMAVYENARWAFESGASREHLLGAIDTALEDEKACIEDDCEAHEEDQSSKQEP
jgi:hypothetical protein